MNERSAFFGSFSKKLKSLTIFEKLECQNLPVF